MLKNYILWKRDGWSQKKSLAQRSEKFMLLQINIEHGAFPLSLQHCKIVKLIISLQTMSPPICSTCTIYKIIDLPFVVRDPADLSSACNKIISSHSILTNRLNFYYDLPRSQYLLSAAN